MKYTKNIQLRDLFNEVVYCSKELGLFKEVDLTELELSVWSKLFSNLFVDNMTFTNKYRTKKYQISSGDYNEEKKEIKGKAVYQFEKRDVSDFGETLAKVVKTYYFPLIYKFENNNYFQVNIEDGEDVTIEIEIENLNVIPGLEESMRFSTRKYKGNKILDRAMIILQNHGKGFSGEATYFFRIHNDHQKEREVINFKIVNENGFRVKDGRNTSLDLSKFISDYDLLCIKSLDSLEKSMKATEYRMLDIDKNQFINAYATVLKERNICNISGKAAANLASIYQRASAFPMFDEMSKEEKAKILFEAGNKSAKAEMEQESEIAMFTFETLYKKGLTLEVMFNPVYPEIYKKCKKNQEYRTLNGYLKFINYVYPFKDDYEENILQVSLSPFDLWTLLVKHPYHEEVLEGQ